MILIKNIAYLWNCLCLIVFLLFESCCDDDDDDSKLAEKLSVITLEEKWNDWKV